MSPCRERYRLFASSCRFISSVALLGFCHPCFLGQVSTTPNPRATPVPRVTAADKASSSDEEQAPNSIEEEMRAKRIIKFAEKAYQENLDRAREASDVGEELHASFQRKSSLDREDIKKLDRLEKLTKRIRNEAGGSDEKITIEKPPSDLGSAVDRLAKVSESLKDKVEKTPRQVVSAAVIDEANVLLEVIRIVRTSPLRSNH